MPRSSSVDGRRAASDMPTCRFGGFLGFLSHARGWSSERAGGFGGGENGRVSAVPAGLFGGFLPRWRKARYSAARFPRGDKPSRTLQDT